MPGSCKGGEYSQKWLQHNWSTKNTPFRYQNLLWSGAGRGLGERTSVVDLEVICVGKGCHNFWTRVNTVKNACSKIEYNLSTNNRPFPDQNSQGGDEIGRQTWVIDLGRRYQDLVKEGSTVKNDYSTYQHNWSTNDMTGRSEPEFVMSRGGGGLGRRISIIDHTRICRKEFLKEG